MVFGCDNKLSKQVLGWEIHLSSDFLTDSMRHCKILFGNIKNAVVSACQFIFFSMSVVTYFVKIWYCHSSDHFL